MNTFETFVDYNNNNNNVTLTKIKPDVTHEGVTLWEMEDTEFSVWDLIQI